MVPAQINLFAQIHQENSSDRTMSLRELGNRDAKRRLPEICALETKRALLSRPSRPLAIEATSVVKRFLRSDARRRQSGVEICAAYSFLFGQSLAEKDGETSDEGIAGAGAVDALHRERP